jgi:hypothetical protein
VQQASEATDNTMPAPCGVIPLAEAYSFNVTVVWHSGGVVHYVTIWPGVTRENFSGNASFSTPIAPEGMKVAVAALSPRRKV